MVLDPRSLTLVQAIEVVHQSCCKSCCPPVDLCSIFHHTKNGRCTLTIRRWLFMCMNWKPGIRNCIFGQHWTHLFLPCLSLLLTDLPYDLWPCQCGGENIQPDRHDVAAVPLGRLPPVPGASATRLPSGLLGIPKRYGCKYCHFYLLLGVLLWCCDVLVVVCVLRVAKSVTGRVDENIVDCEGLFFHHGGCYRVSIIEKALVVSRAVS